MPTPMDNGYKMVADRHLQFVADHPDGSVSSNVTVTYDPAEGKGFVFVKAEVWKKYEDRTAGLPPNGEGNASMPIPGPTSFTKNSEVENAETSALGRALAMIGYHAKETMASGEEISSKKGADEPKEDSDKATQAQLNRMFALAKEAGIDLATDEGKKTLQAIVLAATGKRSSKQLKKEDMDKVYSTLESTETVAA